MAPPEPSSESDVELRRIGAETAVPVVDVIEAGDAFAHDQAAQLESMRLEPYAARAVIEQSGVHGDDGGMTTRLLSAPVALAPPPIVSAIPEPQAIVGVDLECGDFTAAAALSAMKRARQIRLFGYDRRSYFSICPGVVKTKTGSMTVRFMNGERGHLDVPGRGAVLFEWDP